MIPHAVNRHPLTLGFIEVGAVDPTPWIPFATDLLGMEVAPKSPQGALRFKMDQRAYRLAVSAAPANKLACAGWEARSLSAMESVVTAVESAGVAITQGDAALCNERSVSTLFWFDDPAGVRCEVYVGMRVEEERPFRSPLNVGFLTGEQGVGHINLMVDNYQETFDFYARVLGFGVSDYRPSSRGLPMAFMGCDTRHHSYGIMDSRGAGTTLDHIMIEVCDFTDVGRAYDKVIDGAAQLSLTMGKHWNDQMTSFYVESPSGFDMEYGWGGRTIDRASWSTLQFNSAAIWGHRAASAKAAERIGARTWIDMANLAGRGAD